MISKSQDGSPDFFEQAQITINVAEVIGTLISYLNSLNILSPMEIAEFFADPSNDGFIAEMLDFSNFFNNFAFDPIGIPPSHETLEIMDKLIKDGVDAVIRFKASKP